MGFDYLVCDSPAGIETGALMASYFADDALVVTNPEVSSVRDSDRILGILSAKSRRAERGEEPIKEYLLLTRYNPKRVAEGEMLSLKDIRSEEHTSELQSLMRISYAVFCLKKKNSNQSHTTPYIY